MIVPGYSAISVAERKIVSMSGRIRVWERIRVDSTNKERFGTRLSIAESLKIERNKTYVTLGVGAYGSTMTSFFLLSVKLTSSKLSTITKNVH